MPRHPPVPLSAPHAPRGADHVMTVQRATVGGLTAWRARCHGSTTPGPWSALLSEAIDAAWCAPHATARPA